MDMILQHDKDYGDLDLIFNVIMDMIKIATIHWFDGFVGDINLKTVLYFLNVMLQIPDQFLSQHPRHNHEYPT